MLVFLAFIVTLALLIFKVTGVVVITYWVVFSPFLLLIGLGLAFFACWALAVGIITIFTYVVQKVCCSPMTSYLPQSVPQTVRFSFIIFPLITLVLIGIKIFNMLGLTWTLALAPLYIATPVSLFLLGVYILVAYLTHKGLPRF